MGSYTPDLVIGSVTLSDDNWDGQELPRWQDAREPDVRELRGGTIVEVWPVYDKGRESMDLDLRHITIAQYSALLGYAQADPPVTTCSWLGESCNVSVKVLDRGYVQKGYWTETHRTMRLRLNKQST